MKHVVITGASGGLGSELARTFAQQGDTLMLGYHEAEASVFRLSEEIKELGGKHLIGQLDLRKPKSIQEMAKRAIKEWKRIDVWINNAAITQNHLLQDLKIEDWNTILDVNLRGTFLGMQEAAKAMIPNQDGHIINISSLVGLRGGVGQAAYAASKAGLIGLTKSLAKELGSDNIRTNAVLPGLLPTAMTHDISPKNLRSLTAENTLGHGSDLREVSHFIAHLAGMKHVSGQTFNLDSRIF